MKELEECYNIAKLAMTKIENPFPAGVDKETYFTQNYHAFGQSPEKYGYVMFSQIVEIYENRTLTDFDSYLGYFFEEDE